MMRPGRGGNNWNNRNWDNWGRGGRGSNRGRGGWNRPSYDNNRRGDFMRGRGRPDYGRNFNRDWDLQFKRQNVSKRLSEKQIGVTEYISDHEGFNGIIKMRYSDFQVSEINESGVIAKLTNMDPPEIPKDKEIEDDEDLLISKYNPEILSIEIWDKINSLAIKKEETDECVEVDATEMSKEDRTKVHEAVKKAFGNSIIASTVNTENKKVLRFETYHKGVRIDKRVKWVWPGEYVYFIVHKENIDTMDAAAQITQRLKLNLKPSMLGYAGTKDRRGKTTQWFSLRKVDPHKLYNACKDLRNIYVGNYSFANEGLQLGMLLGNRFRIVVRNVKAPNETIDTCCRNLQTRGFINYYGLQRFGTNIKIPTYEIGLRMLKGDFKGAVQFIMESARQSAAEIRFFSALYRKPNDLHAALDKLPRNTRLLYIHSYQSLIWNKCVSERIKRFGLNVAVGDLVAVDPDSVEQNEDVETTAFDMPDEEEQIKPEDSKLREEAQTNEDCQANSEAEKVQVKPITQDDIDNNRYTIFDVILPLPGYMIQYPPNIKDYYEELLSNDGLDLLLKNKIKKYSMSGAYRRMIARIGDFKWSHVRYSSTSEDLLLSDIDLIRGVPQPENKEDAPFRALILEMSLPASCYATMALRELMKIDTACDFQALQNVSHGKGAKTVTDANSEQSKETEKETDEAEKTCEEENKSEKGEMKRKLSESDDDQSKKMKNDE